MSAPGRARHIGEPLTQLLETARASWPHARESWQFHRTEYLLATGRVAEVFDEGLFRWLQQKILAAAREAGRHS